MIKEEAEENIKKPTLAGVQEDLFVCPNLFIFTGVTFCGVLFLEVTREPKILSLGVSRMDVCVF